MVRVNLDASSSPSSAMSDRVNPFFPDRLGDVLLPFLMVSLLGLRQGSPERRVFSIICPLSGLERSLFASWPNTSQASWIGVLFFPLPRPLWYFLSLFAMLLAFKISSTISLFARPLSFLLSISVTFLSCRISGLLDSKWVTQLAFIPNVTKKKMLQTLG